MVSYRLATGPLPHSSILFRPHQQRRFPALVPPLLVEAPGYCPPGPKCLFHPIVYRHSRLPGLAKIGICGHFFKQLTNVRLSGTVTETMALELPSGASTLP